MKFPTAKDDRAPEISVQKNAKKPHREVVPQPFQMPGELVSRRYHDKFRDRIAEEQRRARELAEFKARPVPSYYPATYAKTVGGIDLTDTNSTMGATAIRIAERHAYEQHRAEQQNVALIEKQRQDDLKAMEELAEIARLRREAEFKAAPYEPRLETFKKVPPKPVTEAVTPAVLTRVSKK